MTGNRVEGKGFNLFPRLSREGVVMVAVAGSCMAAVTQSVDRRYTLYLVNDLEEPVPLAASDVGISAALRPTALAVVPGEFTADGRMEALLGTADRSIVVVDAAGVGRDQELDGVLMSVVQMLAVSPYGKYVAVFGEKAEVTVLDLGFERRLLQYDTRSETLPSQMVWCAEDAIVLTWPDARGVMLVGPHGDCLQLEYEGAAHVVQEADGFRLLTARTHKLVQQVPPELERVRSITSTSPAAILTMAAAYFKDGDARCDDEVRGLQEDDTLRDAVAECIGAALTEWEHPRQATLLRAASYGKAFDITLEASAFVDACKRLRVLNSLREFDAGMPLTAAQFDALTPPVVVDRLCARHKYRLALNVCDYLAMPKDKVLVHWACAKVRGARPGEPDEAIRDTIRRNLAGVAGVSYADIAATADSAGRRRLATLLLDFEPRASDQVPILLKMREGPLALEKALDSGDADLVYLALLHLRRGVAVAAAAAGASGGLAGGDSAPAAAAAAEAEADEAFMRVVLAYPAAIDLLAAYYHDRGMDPTLLVKLFAAAGRHNDAGHVLVAAAYAESSGDGRVRLLRRAADQFRDGERNPRGTGVERASCAFYRACTEEQVALLATQVELERDLHTDTFVDTSLTDTIHNLVVLGENKRAAAVKDAHKMSDAAFWYTKLRALAKARDWVGLAKFADERRSPIGYKPFVEACMEEHANVEAKKYVARISDYAEKVDMYVAVGAIPEAAELALKQRDLDKLNQLGEMAKLPAAIEAVEKAIATLTGGKR